MTNSSCTKFNFVMVSAILISILLCFLTIFLPSKSYQTLQIVLYITLLPYFIFELSRDTEREWENQLVTIRLIRYLLYIIIIYLLVILGLKFYFLHNNSKIAEYIFVWSLAFRGTIVAISSLYFVYHRKIQLELSELFSLGYIMIYYPANALVSTFQTNIVLYHRILEFLHPSIINLSLYLLSNAFLLINSIIDWKKISNLEISHIIIFYLAPFNILIIHPILELLASTLRYSSLRVTVNILITSDIILVGSILIFLLHHNKILFQNTKAFNQPIQLLMVIQKSGLPIISHKFGSENESIKNDMLLSGSLKAVYNYLSDVHESANLKKIELVRNIIHFDLNSDMIFLLSARYDTKLIGSMFSNFTEYFVKIIQNRYKEDDRVIDDLYEDEAINELISSLFYQGF